MKYMTAQYNLYKEGITMKEINKLEPLREVFEFLCKQLKGFNMTDELFDFDYKNYTLTLVYRNNQIKLADNVDVYDEHDNYIGNFKLETVNNMEGVNHE